MGYIHSVRFIFISPGVLGCLAFPFFGESQITRTPPDRACAIGTRYLQNLQYAAAKNALIQCYSADTYAVDILHQLATCCYRLGHFAEAKIHYQSFIQWGTTNGSAYYKSATKYELLNKYLKAEDQEWEVSKFVDSRIIYINQMIHQKKKLDGQTDEN